MWFVRTLVVSGLGASVASADIVSSFEGFEAGNPSGWTFGVTTPDIVETAGGNPGGWLHNPGIVSFAPIATHAWGADDIPTDFRDEGIATVSVDAQTVSNSFGDPVGFEFSIVLRNTRGTPGVVDDDDFAYFVGPQVPLAGEGWLSYEFDIPSESTDAVPPGWSGGWVGDPENFRPGVEWSDVITNVDRIEFWWLNPAFFAILRDWDVGIDNVEILPACVGIELPAPIGDVRLRASPNPFAASTTIAVSRGSTLRVYDARGRLVRQLAASDGRVAWDGADARGRAVANGVYYLEAGTDVGVERGRVTVRR